MKYIYGEEMPNKDFKKKVTLKRAGTSGVKDNDITPQDLPSGSKKDKDKDKDVEDADEPDLFVSPEKKGPTSAGNNANNANKIKIQRLKIKRPIIFICNDPYSRSLKELRKRALVFSFKKPDTTKLMKRLHDICRKEVRIYCRY